MKKLKLSFWLAVATDRARSSPVFLNQSLVPVILLGPRRWWMLRYVAQGVSVGMFGYGRFHPISSEFQLTRASLVMVGLRVLVTAAITPTVFSVSGASNAW